MSRGPSILRRVVAILHVSQELVGRVRAIESVTGRHRMEERWVALGPWGLERHLAGARAARERYGFFDEVFSHVTPAHRT